jgi:K+/H+ antiporter YhaU regulatory subunit KhtT
VVLFSLERVSAEVTALGILLFLILTGLLPTKEAFAGFGNDVAVMVLRLLILMGALVRTGVTDFAGRAILRWAGTDTNQLLLVMMIAVVVLSAFMSNTAATAFLLPVVIGLAQRAKVSRAKLLMPLAFAAILSSSITLVSTSTNIIVSGLMARYGLPPMGMFELAVVGLPIAIVGVGYMFTLGRHLVPDRISVQQIEDFSVDLYLAEILVLRDSPLVGQTLSESGLGRDLDLTVVRIDRGEESLHAPQATTRLHQGDVLLVEGGREGVLHVKEEVGIDIRADIELSDPKLHTEDVGLIEAILLPGSPLIGRTLKGLRFREQYGLQVLGINRRGGDAEAEDEPDPPENGRSTAPAGRSRADNGVGEAGHLPHAELDRDAASQQASCLAGDRDLRRGAGCGDAQCRLTTRGDAAGGGARFRDSLHHI